MNSTTHPAGTRFVLAASGHRATVNGWRGTSVSFTWDEGGTAYQPAAHIGRTMTEAEYDAKRAEEDAAWEAESAVVAERIAAEEASALIAAEPAAPKRARRPLRPDMPGDTEREGGEPRSRHALPGVRRR